MGDVISILDDRMQIFTVEKIFVGRLQMFDKSYQYGPVGASDSLVNNIEIGGLVGNNPKMLHLCAFISNELDQVADGNHERHF